MIYLVIVLAISLRLINLNQSLWLDEVFMVKSTQFYSLSYLLTQYLPFDFNPPLSYLVTYFYNHVFGYSEIALRIPSVIFAVITIWLFYRLTQIIMSQKSALFASLLLATSGLHLYYSQEARMYSLATLGVTGATWALLSFIKNHKHQYWYLFFLVVSLYSHYLAWFILPAHLGLIVWLKFRQLKSVIKLQLAALAALLPWLPILAKQLEVGLSAASSGSPWSQVVGGLSLKDLSLIPIKFLIGRISLDNNLYFALIMILPITLVAYLFWVAVKHQSQNQLAFKVILSWLLIPFLFILLISLKVPVLSYFRLLFLLPAFYLGITYGLSFTPKKVKTLLALSFLSLNLVSSGIYLFNSKFHRENWRELAQVLVTNNSKDFPVIIIPTVDAPLKYYYASNNIVSTDKLDSILDQSELWLVPYAQPIFDPNNQTQATLFKAGFKETFKQHFRGNLTLVQYTKSSI